MILRIPTNFNIDLEFEVPEFYRRLLAWLIDVAILYFYLKIAGVIFENVASNGNPFSKDRDYNLHFFSILLWVPVFIYHPFCEITLNGQSPGKKIMGLRVVNENGGKPGISQFLIRWLIRTADLMIVIIILLNVYILANKQLMWALIGSIGLLITDIVLVIATRKGQRLGDILAKTILIRINTRGSIEDTVFVDVADNYIPSFPQIMRLNDKDINAIKSILETAKKRGDYNMAAAASEKIKTHLQINSSLPPFDFLDILLKDYNYHSVK
ncbi:MAG TPA: RDD family protein [Chitinophagaceae bacterium]|nr:RDD family protein [Chitinophagaceae bacterium]